MDFDRRANFQQIVRERGDLGAAAEDAFLEGERSLSTANAIYRLFDGFCISVDDLGLTGKPAALVGMQLVGWIPLTQDAVIDTWEPGASALFLRAATKTTAAKLAVTSAVFDLSASVVEEERVSQVRESYVRETRVSVPRPDVSFGPPQRRPAVTNIHQGLVAPRSSASASAAGPVPSSKAPPLPPMARASRR